MPETWELEGQGWTWRFSRCPMKVVTRQSWAFLRAYGFFNNKGGWPNPGEWPKQPNKLIEAFEVIAGEAGKEK